MTGRRPTRIDSGEYARCLDSTEAPVLFNMSTGMRDLLLGWWRERTKHPADVDPEHGSRLIVSRPVGAEDDIQLATRAWRVLGKHGFEVAAETGHRITDVARTLGYTGVYGIAAGNITVATLAVAASPDSGEIDALLPDIIDQTNKLFEGDAVPVRLPLEGMLRSYIRA